MLYPLGTLTSLDSVVPKYRDGEDAAIVNIAANRERVLFVVVKAERLQIHFAEPEVLIAVFLRSKECILEKGQNKGAVWKSDSSCLAVWACALLLFLPLLLLILRFINSLFTFVKTDKPFILFNRIQCDSKTQSYLQCEASNSRCNRSSHELFPKGHIPRVQLIPAFTVQLAALPTKVISLRDELMVASKDGWIRRLFWNGSSSEELSVSVCKIPVSCDQLQSRVEYLSDLTCVVDIAYSPLIGGFSLAFSDGRGCLLTSANVKFPPAHVHGIWATGISDAVCTTVNHKYRLLAFGQRCGSASLFAVDEVTGALSQTHKVQAADIKDASAGIQLGALCYLSWSPYGEILATSWEFGGLAVWSVFGSLLWCLFDISDVPLYSPSEGILKVTTMDWGPEGFRVWLCANNRTSETKLTSSAQSSRLCSMKFVRVMNLGCPSVANGSSCILMGDKEVHIAPFKHSSSTSFLRTSVHWDVLQAPINYIGGCWPLRYCAFDSADENVAIAGTYGLAHYSRSSRKWRLFGNETQEKEFAVSGGLCWWEEFVVCACFHAAKQNDEIRLYPRTCNLDNIFCSSHLTICQVLQMSIQGNVLLTFDIEGRVSLLGLSLIESDSYPRAAVIKFAEIQIAELIPHPVCVTSIQLTSLNHDTHDQSFCDGADTLLVNIAGRLVMMYPEKPRPASPQNGGGGSRLNQPMLVASFVENVWCSPDTDLQDKPHLSKALWMQCGNRGMKVWMPLFPKNSSEQAHAFISKRIMLPFETDVYPLAVSYEQCLVSGVESLVQSCVIDKDTAVPSYYLQRNSEVCLHHILRQLLKRNLGLYALEIGRTCLDLPYFSHVLELLLHTVLEEEATSSEPIPDPLLPRVVAFIQEFPEFLQTVAHCARKTEMALWTHLFAAVGSPIELFEVCLRENNLETAASYLIVLQNMESASESKGHATRLLEATLDSCQWATAKEIVRFLKSIDPLDIESAPRTCMNAKQLRQQAASALISPTAADEASETFLFHQPASVSHRHRFMSVTTPSPESPTDFTSASVSAAGGTVSANTSFSTSNAGAPNPVAVSSTVTSLASTRKSVLVKSTSESTRFAAIPCNRNSKRHSFSGEDHPVHFYINLILTRCARELLAAYRIYDLGCFSAHLDFHLVLWLSKEKNRAAKVQDFVEALQRLHADFDWPLPLLTLGIMDYLSKKMQLMMASPKQESSLGEPLHIVTSPNTPMTASNDSGISAAALEQRQSGRSRATDDSIKSLLMKQNRGELSLSPRILEAQLRAKQEGGSVVGTEATEDSSSLFDVEHNGAWEDNVSGTLDLEWENVEHLCAEVANKGSQNAESELRFMQQILLEAGCLDWCLLICLLLRDLVGLARAINLSTLMNAPPDMIRRLRTGVNALEAWAEKNCLGYKPLLNVIQNHLESLQRSNENLQAQQQLTASNKSQPRPVSSAAVTPISIKNTPTNNNHSAADESIRHSTSNGVLHVADATNAHDGLRIDNHLPALSPSACVISQQTTSDSVPVTSLPLSVKSLPATNNSLYEQKLSQIGRRNAKIVSLDYFPHQNANDGADRFHLQTSSSYAPHPHATNGHLSSTNHAENEQKSAVNNYPPGVLNSSHSVTANDLVNPADINEPGQCTIS